MTMLSIVAIGLAIMATYVREDQIIKTHGNAVK